MLRKLVLAVLAVGICLTPLACPRVDEPIDDIRPVAPLEPTGVLVNGVREVQVTAFSFGYRPDPVVVRLNEAVRLIARTEDITHGLTINEFDVDILIEPDEAVTAEFVADRAGHFEIICTIPGHEAMRATLVVTEEWPPEELPVTP